MSLEELLAVMLVEAWHGPTEFDREMAKCAIQIVGAGMSQAELISASVRAVALFRNTEA